MLRFFIGRAGTGKTAAVIAEIKQNMSLSSGRDLRLVVMLIDSRHPASKDDMMMLDYLIEGQFPMKIVLTKIDKLKPNERKNRLAAIPDELDIDLAYMLPFSAVTGEGAEELRSIITECVSEQE